MAEEKPSKKQIIERGKRIYRERLKDEAERSHMGQFVAVDVQSGDYEFGANDIDAILRILERRPDAMLFGIRVGEEVAYRFGFGRVANSK